MKLPSPTSLTPPRLLVNRESFSSFNSLELIPDTLDDTLVVEEAAAISDVSVAVDASEYDPYAEDDIDVANTDEETEEL